MKTNLKLLFDPESIDMTLWNQDINGAEKLQQMVDNLEAFFRHNEPGKIIAIPRAEATETGEMLTDVFLLLLGQFTDHNGHLLYLFPGGYSADISEYLESFEQEAKKSLGIL